MSSQKGEIIYWSLAQILEWTVWRGNLVNPEDLPREYPVVFIANHAAALGPIAVTSSLPIRLYPWVISDMVDWKMAPDYLRRDFVEPQLHIPSSWSLFIARLLSQVSVRLLRRIECIPVWHDERLPDTYRVSVDYLMNGRSLLIFPEDPALPTDELHHMSPFYKGFTRLAEAYYEQTKRTLVFSPLAVHPLARRMKVGSPILYHPENEPAKERIRIKHALESAIQQMVIELGNMQAALPHK